MTDRIFLPAFGRLFDFPLFPDPCGLGAATEEAAVTAEAAEDPGKVVKPAGTSPPAP